MFFLADIKIKQLIVFSLLSLGVCTMKSNGYYMFLLCIPFIVLAFRKQRLKLLIASLVPFLIAFVINGAVFDSAGVRNSDVVEKLSIPIQQVARVITDGRALNEQEATLIGEIVDISRVHDEYRPAISDYMKMLIRNSGNMDKLTLNASQYLKLYLGLGLKYPVSYLKAWIDQTKGYIEPTTYWVVAMFGSGNTIVENSIGLTTTPLLGSGLHSLLTYVSFAYEAVPVYNLLWTVGFYMLMMLFAFALSWIKRLPLVHFVPHIILLLGLLLFTPVHSEFRYGYQTVLAVPFLLGTAIYSVVGAGSNKEEMRTAA